MAGSIREHGSLQPGRIPIGSGGATFEIVILTAELAVNGSATANTTRWTPGAAPIATESVVTIYDAGFLEYFNSPLEVGTLCLVGRIGGRRVFVRHKCYP